MDQKKQNYLDPNIVTKSQQPNNPIKNADETIKISLSKMGFNISSPKITKNIIIEEEIIKSISLDALIILLTSEKQIFCEIATDMPLTIKNMRIFLDCFLSSFAISPSHSDFIIKRIIDHFHGENLETLENPTTTRFLDIQQNCCFLLKKWIEICCCEGSSSDMSKSILQIQNLCLEIENNQSFDEAIKEEGRAIESLLVRHLSSYKSQKSKSKDKSLHSTAPFPILPSNNKNLNGDSHLLVSLLNPEELARQVSLIDFELFSAVNLREFLGLAWSKPKHRHRSPNVLKMIYRFNDFSNWIASLIVLPKSLEQRKLILKKIVDLGYFLMKLGNFNSLQAVIAAFGHRAVKRLSLTWESLTLEENKKISEMRDLLSKEKNSLKLRNATEERISNKNPCCPYLGLYLTDLTFVEDANKDKLDNPRFKDEKNDEIDIFAEKELLNWEKRMMIYKIFSTIRSLQLVPFSFVKVHEIQTKLLKLEGLVSDPEALMVLSSERESKKE